MILNARASHQYFDSTPNTRPGEWLDYAYNKRNRLSAVTRNSAAWATYGYNALEQLTTRVSTAPAAPLGQVAYTYDNDNHLLTEATASSGVKTRDYIWLPSNDNNPVDLPLAVIDIVGTTHTLTHVHADHLGRPTRMTSSTTSTVWQASYKPWGEVQTLSGTVTNNLRFPGQYYQIETGLAHNHHRHYDPVTGRYIQPDPLGFVDGPSVYAYAGNSPYMRTDREGESAQLIGAGLGAIAGAGYVYWDSGGCASWGDLAKGALGGALIGSGFGALAEIGVVARVGITLVRHHSVPRAIMSALPRNVARNSLVRGARGRPNIFKVSESMHKTAQSSPKRNYFRGGDYNRAFDKAIKEGADYNKITPQEVRDIATRLMKEFFP